MTARQHASTPDEFFAGWRQDALGVKELCGQLYAYLETLTLRISVADRPGVSFSIRGAHAQRPDAFVILLDVIDDAPEARWLSLCMPDALISDPDELGDWIPQGLNGQDARCFSLERADTAEHLNYLCQRMAEAAQPRG